MITIEVLISMLILFMVVATSVATLKQLKIIRLQQVKHEELYINVLNIKEMLEGAVCKKFLETSGSVNGFEYRAKCSKIAEKRSYKKDFEEGIDGNFGNELVTLYKVELTLKKGRFEKAYNYLETVVRTIR